jgi:biotin synthase
MYKELLDKLYKYHELTYLEYLELIKNWDEVRHYASLLASKTCMKYYRNKIYISGLIEFTNYC